jgi:GxxExxY protein
VFFYIREEINIEGKKMLRHEKLTYQLNRLFMDTHNALRTGWPEEIYHEGFVEMAKKTGTPVDSKPRKTIYHRGREIHTFECDALAFDLIILEFKVLPYTGFAPGHLAQLISYLKCWQKDLGLLVNFGGTRVKVQRVVWDEPLLKPSVNFEALQGKLTGDEKEYLNRVQKVSWEIGKQYGLGYSDTIYRPIVEIEFKSAELHCQPKLLIPANMEGKILADFESQYMLVNGKCLLSIRAILEHPTRYDFAQMKTFLRNMNLKIGLIVNFGKKELQIFGVNPD